MSANRRTPAPPLEEIKLLKAKKQALRKRIKELEAERDQYIHAANAFAIKMVTVDQIKEWEKEEEASDETLMDVIRRLEKEGKREKEAHHA